jgi:short-subunit dehydrogenase involved in D-alanine esterification of teichoic acids
MALSFDFKNKNVLVVGGTSGINRGIAETLRQSRCQGRSSKPVTGKSGRYRPIT